MEIIEMMLYIDSEGFTKPLNGKYHSPRYWSLEAILRERHGSNWFEKLNATA